MKKKYVQIVVRTDLYFKNHLMEIKVEHAIKNSLSNYEQF